MKKRPLASWFGFATALVITSIVAFYSGGAALAAVAVTTSSTSSTSTADSQQRKTWYDGTRYWVAFYDGTHIDFYYSTTGSSWTQNTSATITTSATQDFSIEADSSRAFIVYNDQFGVPNFSSAASYPGISFSWNAPSTIGDGLSDNSPSIARDTSGYVHVCFGDSPDVLPGSFVWGCEKSTNPNDSPAAWGSTLSVGSFSGSVAGAVAPLASQNMYTVYVAGTSLKGSQYTNGTGWSAPTTIATVSSGPSNITSLTGDSTNNAAYLTYIDGSGHAVFKKYTSSAWQTPVTLDSNAGNTYPSITRDTNTGNLYAFWIRSNTTFCQSAASPYTAWSTCSNFSSFNTSTNTYLTSPASFSSATSSLPFIWTSGTSPYSVEFDKVTFISNAAPAAPTLSTPASGATGVSATPSFQLRTTDADNDYLRYKILLCQDAACSTVLYTWDQTSSQLGWTGQDQQSSTAYTGNSVITSSTLASFQPSVLLSVGTQYYWEAFAIDPGGTNTWSSASAIQSFTTTGSEVDIHGGTNITGGTTIQ